MSVSAPLESFTEKPHILVVDDDDRIRDLVSRYLRDHEFMVLTAADAAEAGEMLSRFSFDALVVDIMMPGQTGLEFTAHLRKSNDVPVLLLTALGETDDRIKGLESGADDYLAKPFEPRELVLRLNAILRRTIKPAIQTDKPFRMGRWVFDPSSGTLEDDGEVQRLTSMEINLLKALSSEPGQPIDRDTLAELCGIDTGERTIDVQVTRLRRKIEEDTKTPRYLQTVRGKGYLLRMEDV